MHRTRCFVTTTQPANIGPPAKRHLKRHSNGVSLAGRMWPTYRCLLITYCFWHVAMHCYIVFFLILGAPVLILVLKFRDKTCFKNMPGQRICITAGHYRPGNKTLLNGVSLVGRYMHSNGVSMAGR